MGEKLVAWRDPQCGVQLSLGGLKGDGIQSPFHRFGFDTSGACILVPANGRNVELPRAIKAHPHPTREAHGFIYLRWGEPRESCPELPFFESIGEDMVYGSLHDHWATHYSRAIENQLVTVHVLSVHYSTIGHVNKSVVNGPLCRIEVHYPGDNLLNIWVFNEADRGQTTLKASQVPEPNRRPSLPFRFPNVWHNWISDDVRAMIAFVPIGDEHTLMYVRFYHRTRTPVIRNIINFVGSLSNKYIECQDKVVVITQQPKHSDLDIGGKLILGDGLIIAYRKIRRRLIEEAGSEKRFPRHY